MCQGVDSSYRNRTITQPTGHSRLVKSLRLALQITCAGNHYPNIISRRGNSSGTMVAAPNIPQHVEAPEIRLFTRDKRSSALQVSLMRLHSAGQMMLVYLIFIIRCRIYIISTWNEEETDENRTWWRGHRERGSMGDWEERMRGREMDKVDILVQSCFALWSGYHLFQMNIPLNECA